MKGLNLDSGYEFQPYLHLSSNNCSGAVQSSVPQVLPLTHADTLEDNRKGTTGTLNTGPRTRLSSTEHPRLLITTVSCGNSYLLEAVGSLGCWSGALVEHPSSDINVICFSQRARKQLHPNAARPTASVFYRKMSTLEPQDLWGPWANLNKPSRSRKGAKWLFQQLVSTG